MFQSIVSIVFVMSMGMGAAAYAVETPLEAAGTTSCGCKHSAKALKKDVCGQDGCSPGTCEACANPKK